jgi:predicted Zn-dependent protease
LIASRDVISPAWNRNQEDQADLLGVDIMVAAGYQPREVLKVLKVLENIEFGVETPERVSAENAYANFGKRMVAQNRNSPLGDFGKFFDKAFDEVGGVISRTLADARRSHRSVDERGALIRDYARREYASVNTQARAGSYKGALGEARTKQVLANYAQSTAALKRLTQGSNAQALDPAQKGVGAPTERDSYTRLILSQVQFARGDRKGGIASLQTATQGPNPALRTYLVLSETYAKSGDFKSAWQVAEAAQKRYQHSEMLLVHRISLQARSGRRNEAQAMAVQCKLEYPALDQACAEAATRGVSSVK